MVAGVERDAICPNFPIVRAAIRGWNAAVEGVPGWPQQRLTLPEIRREGYVLPAESFPASFQKSLTAYLAFLANPPDDDDAPINGLRPATLALREFQFRQMASALVHRGVADREDHQHQRAGATRERGLDLRLLHRAPWPC